ncbi:hypothetical protein E2C01_076695 [Portunus trituberculatus]|uniref:Uncharacterized protein n=1 Tax=Portunus trituberculatus TaxID=210409 RepID=A0A5B7ICA2_PORTR|nr:hypothetical protein [Portunus trituberculatus]
MPESPPHKKSYKELYANTGHPTGTLPMYCILAKAAITWTRYNDELYSCSDILDLP